jgi:hypothetical protein
MTGFLHWKGRGPAGCHAFEHPVTVIDFTWRMPLSRPPCSTRRTFLKSAAGGLIGLGVTTAGKACHPYRRLCCVPWHNAPIAQAAFTCDFGVSKDLPPDQIVGVLERDRTYMSARPGFVHKHVPLRINSADGSFLSGGRYLFETAQDAATYKNWVENDFILDGTRFFDRPYIHKPDCHIWNVVGMLAVGDITNQVVTRMERWQVPAGADRSVLQGRWPLIVEGARQRWLSGVWLLDIPQDQLVGLVYFRDRVLPANPADQQDPQKVAEATLAGLERLTPLGQVFDDQGWGRLFDRTQWVLTVWFPFVAGDQGRRPLWPNSPPLPGPSLP